MARWNRENPRPNPVERVIGIDGEGQGRREHLYKFLAAADEAGTSWQCEGRGKGGRLTSEQCFDFLLSLPNRALVFGFSFFYDLTKWFEDLPARAIYLLVHEEERERLVDGKVLFRPVRWRNYYLNYMNRRFTVATWKWDHQTGRRKITRRRTVWDVFGFFQSKFTKALTDWSVGTKAELEHLARMKDKRQDFDRLPWDEVKAYCLLECRRLAILGRSLISAHEDAGLRLRSYFGAGSTASVLLKTFGVRELRGEIPEAMREAVACSFFGGRFENSVLGPVERPCHNHDISSAYPYHATRLPCLVHGRWERLQGSGLTEQRLLRARLALVRWKIGRTSGPEAWGPLPVRKADGTIAFPLSAPEGGWTWRDEFVAARLMTPTVEAREAWVYDTDCDCRPFGRLPWYYLERLKIGKEGKGIVFKLGPNSVYGKLAQSKGLFPPYQSWVWAGNITSGCRAQLLRAIASAADPWSVLMVATDGIWSTEKLQLPAPEDTGTSDAIDPKDGKKKPLGGWEHKEFPRGVFCVRPGIYFPLAPTEDEMDKVRARGLGRSVLYEQWQRVVDAHASGRAGVRIKGRARFVGAKTGIRWSGARGAERSPDYGRWVKHAVDVTFDPRPKRRPEIGSGGRLVPWERFDVPSFPYDDAIKGPEARLLALAKRMAEEQPDADYGEVE